MTLRLWRRLSYLWRQRSLEAELAEELDFHRDMKRAELERTGTPAGEASTATRKALGNVALAREDAREIWRWRWFDALCCDVHSALRSLRRQPAFAVVAIATLAAGIGATTALFSLLYATVVNPFASHLCDGTAVRRAPAQ
jgi:hypothetical protein